MFTDSPFWFTPMKNQFGKPWLDMPCRVLSPCPQWSKRDRSSRPITSKLTRRWRRGRHLEPRGVDDAIDLVLDAVRDDALLGDAVHAFALAHVDEVDVGPVEGLEVLVVERRALAELAVPGLQRFPRLRIGHRVVHPPANLVHLAEILDLRRERQFLRIAFHRLFGRKHRLQAAEDVRPAVRDEVFLERAADHDVGEVLAPLALPARLQ